MSPDDAMLPPRGKFAKILLTAALDDCNAPAGVTFPPGVYLARPNLLIISHGSRAAALRFEAAEDAARLALGLHSLAVTMADEAGQAADAADARLARVLAEREAAGNA